MRYVVDIVGVLLIVLNIGAGFAFGLLRRAFAFVGVFAAVGLASLIGNGVARFFRGSGDPGDLYADAWAFIAIAGAVVLVFEVLGFLYDEKITRVASLMFDRTVGMALGAVVGCLQVAAACLVVLAMARAQAPNDTVRLPDDRAGYGAEVRDSLLGGRVNSVESGLLNAFKPVLPQDFPSHLAESASKQ